MTRPLSEAEYDTFQQLFDSLEKARSASQRIGIMRADRRWSAIAAMLNQVLENTRKLA